MRLIILLLLFPILIYSQTKKEVYSFISSLGVEYTNIVTKQAYYESKHLNSPICKENNNLFGMKLAKQRFTLAIGENRGHAVYRNWKESVLDYYIWQKKYYKGGDYYKFLEQSGYCPNNKEYINTLRQIKL